MYRVGYPFWKTVARLGVPVLVRVHVHRDPESNTYWADSPDLDGLVVAGSDLDELRQEVSIGAHDLIELAMNGHAAKAQTELRLREPSPCIA